MYKQIFENDSYRYIKVAAPHDSHFDLAEIKMYHNDSLIIPQKLFALDKERVSVDNPIENIYDDNALTWFPIDDVSGLCAYMDFGKPVDFSGVYCAARGDGNTIYPGYEYALHRWDGDKWTQIEVFTGEKEIDHICNNVPEYSLLLLTCKTTGVENRPFIVENGKVIWL